MTLGEKIQKLRKSKQLSQEAFADIFMVSRQSVSKWELDQAVPEISKLIELAEYFQITVDELVRDSDRKEKPDAMEVDKLSSRETTSWNYDSTKFNENLKSNSNEKNSNSFESRIGLRPQKVYLMIILFIVFFLYGLYSGSYVTFVSYTTVVFVVICKKMIVGLNKGNGRR